MKKTVFLGICERALPCEKIIGIFDLDKTTVKKDTREFLKINEQKGLVQTVGFDIPLSFIVTADKKIRQKKVKKNKKTGSFCRRFRRRPCFQEQKTADNFQKKKSL